MAKNKLFLYAGLGLGGYLVYRWWKGKRTALPSGAAPAPSGPASTLTNPTHIPSSGVIAPPLTVVPSGSTAAPPPTAGGIDPAVASVVQKWAQTDGRPPVLAMAAAMVPSEYAGMYSVIVNFWDKNIAPDANAVTFWNNLRAKYGW